MDDGTRQLTARQLARRRNPEISGRIGGNIRRARLAAGMTQGQLARALDEWTNSQQISKWENGTHRPVDRTIERLAEVLDVPDAAWFYAQHDEEAAA